MKRIILFLICSLSLLNSAGAQSGYKVIYEADRHGNTISGNIKELVQYVHNGNPIRVGWELHMKQKDSIYTMVHWTDAGFITTLENHVFAQVESIYGQGHKIPKIDELPAIFLNNAEPHGWVAIIGTTGAMRQKFKRDEEMVAMLKKEMTDEEVETFFKKQETSLVNTKWAVLVINK